MREKIGKLTMYEVAEILNTSHTTIYSKINNKEIQKELENFIIYNGKTKYLKPEGIEIIRKYIKETSLEYLESQEELNVSENNQNINNKTLETFIKTLESRDKEFIDNLKSQIAELNKKLDAKDKQIENMTVKLADALETSNKLVENNQILLGQFQNNVMLLESAKNEKSKWNLFNIFKKF